MSDGGVICSHSDLLKQKTRPNTGREFDSRGSTRFMSYDISLKPLTEPSVSHNFIRFLGYAREWFSVIFPGRDSQSSISSPCEGLDHVLVSVIAFQF